MTQRCPVLYVYIIRHKSSRFKFIFTHRRVENSLRDTHEFNERPVTRLKGSSYVLLFYDTISILQFSFLNMVTQALFYPVFSIQIRYCVSDRSLATTSPQSTHYRVNRPWPIQRISTFFYYSRFSVSSHFVLLKRMYSLWVLVAYC